MTETCCFSPRGIPSTTWDSTGFGRASPACWPDAGAVIVSSSAAAARKDCFLIEVLTVGSQSLGGRVHEKKPHFCIMGPQYCGGRMFDWDDLRPFLAVARHGSTTAAAKA